MTDPSSARSVKIDHDERGGWSSDRPRRDGAAERPADVSVRGRVLAPSDRLRYSPGSLVLVVSPTAAEAERFAARVVEDRSAVLSPDKVRRLLADRVPADEIDARTEELLAVAALKRLKGGDSVVIPVAGLDPAERERYVRLAAPNRRPRHLILLEAGRDQVADEDRPALNALRRALDGAELGAEGFHTALRLGGSSIAEVKRLVFRPPPED